MEIPAAHGSVCRCRIRPCGDFVFTCQSLLMILYKATSITHYIVSWFPKLACNIHVLVSVSTILLPENSSNLPIMNLIANEIQNKFYLKKKRCSTIFNRHILIIIMWLSIVKKSRHEVLTCNVVSLVAGDIMTRMHAWQYYIQGILSSCLPKTRTLEQVKSKKICKEFMRYAIYKLYYCRSILTYIIRVWNILESHCN